MGNEINGEYRCGHFVSNDVKELWKVELGLLDELERVCNKYGLKYYVDSGTLLGAVRHKGFIPWDDDIDVAMMADDYNKLCEVAKNEFTDPFFFQTHESEEFFPPWHAKLRDSRTTGYTNYEIENRPMWNRGIFLDILPVYSIPDNRIIRHLRYKLIMTLRYAIHGYELACTARLKKMKPPVFDRAYILYRVLSVFMSPQEMNKRYIQLCDYRNDSTNMVGMTSSFPWSKKMRFPRELVKEFVDLPFEERKVPSPKRYDEYLTIEYGNYMEIRKNAATHSGLTFDVKKSYVNK